MKSIKVFFAISTYMFLSCTNSKNCGEIFRKYTSNNKYFFAMKAFGGDENSGDIYGDVENFLDLFDDLNYHKNAALAISLSNKIPQELVKVFSSGKVKPNNIKYIYNSIKFIFPESPIMDVDYPKDKQYNVKSWYNYYTSQGTEHFFIYYNGKINEDIKTFMNKKNITFLNSLYMDFLTENELTKSNSEARRLIESGSVKIDDQKVELLDINSSDLIGKTLQVGKRKFLKINKK